MKAIDQEKVDIMSTSWLEPQERQGTSRIQDSQHTVMYINNFVDLCSCAKALCITSLKVTFSTSLETS